MIVLKFCNNATLGSTLVIHGLYFTTCYNKSSVIMGMRGAAGGLRPAAAKPPCILWDTAYVTMQT